MNDTGNYNFLEVKDPSSKFSTSAGGDDDSFAGTSNGRPHNQHPPTTPSSNPIETAWERGLRFAKEMKEKALKRKQAEAQDFDDKKMNLSLKDIEDEKENYERHVNIERKPRNDLEDDDLGLPENFDFNQLKRESQAYGGGQRSNNNNNNNNNGSKPSIDHHHHHHHQYEQDRNNYRQRAQNNNQNNMPQHSTASRSSGGAEWHDYWDRGRQPTRGTQKRPSTSRSRERRAASNSSSSSRTSYSSRSSYSTGSMSSRSSSRSSYSSRSASRSPRQVKKKPTNPTTNAQKQPRSQQGSKTATSAAVSTKAPVKQATKQPTASAAAIPKQQTASGKGVLPGRQVSDTALKKAAAESSKAKKTEYVYSS